MDPVDQILDVGRRTRKKPSRMMWIIAVVIGCACTLAFLAIFVFGGDGTPARTGGPQPERGVGFSVGLVVGLAIGTLIGFVIARQVRSSHSSSKSP